MSGVRVGVVFVMHVHRLQVCAAVPIPFFRFAFDGTFSTSPGVW